MGTKDHAQERYLQTVKLRMPAEKKQTACTRLTELFTYHHLKTLDYPHSSLEITEQELLMYEIVFTNCCHILNRSTQLQHDCTSAVIFRKFESTYMIK